MDEKFSDEDQIYMQRALELAALAVGRTSPNPLVGCVIVRDRQIIGEGYHHQAGTPHAEIHALAAAGHLASGSTVYVTLEPCSHVGKTPPCADALIAAGVQRVVIPLLDPNPLVAGSGVQKLQDAGIQVDVGLLEHEAHRLNEVFFKAITTGLPFVLYKTAQTLDGKIATETGDSRWISNEQSRTYVHKLRNVYDVIMVGSQTVLRDDPALTCRLPDGRDPIRVIVDGELLIPENAKVLAAAKSRTIIATTKAAPPDKVAHLMAMPGVEVWQYPSDRRVPLETLLRDLVRRGWNGVLLEGGGQLAGTFFQHGFVDKVEIFLAPKFIGGQGPSPLSGLHVKTMDEALPLYDWQVDWTTGDLHVIGYLSGTTIP